MPIGIMTRPNYFSFQIYIALLNVLACTRNKSKRHSPKLPPGSGLQRLTQILADPARQRKESQSRCLLPKIPKPASPRLAALPRQLGTRHWSIADEATAWEGQARRSRSLCGRGALRNVSAPRSWEIAVAQRPGAAVS